MNYTLVAMVIATVILVEIYRRRKKRKINAFLTSIASEYKDQFTINGKVKFSKIHVLLNTDLKILYSENDIIIYGYDYYRHRNTNFLFHTNKELPSIKGNVIPNYLITNIQVFENDKIIITDENNCEVTIPNKGYYGKERPRLKEQKFIELLNKITTYYNAHN